MAVQVITVSQGGAPMDGTAEWDPIGYEQEAGSQGGGAPTNKSFGVWSTSDSAWAALDDGTSCGTTADTCSVSRSRSVTQNYSNTTFDGVRTCTFVSAPSNGGNDGTCSSPSGEIDDIDHVEDYYSNPTPPQPLDDEVQQKNVTNLAKEFTATYSLTNNIGGGNQYTQSGFPTAQTGVEGASYSFTDPTYTAMDDFEFTSGPSFSGDSLSGTFGRADVTVERTVTGTIDSSAEPDVITSWTLSNPGTITDLLGEPITVTGVGSGDSLWTSVVWSIEQDDTGVAGLNPGFGLVTNTTTSYSEDMVLTFPGSMPGAPVTGDVEVVVSVTKGDQTTETTRTYTVNVSGGGFPGP